MTTEWHYSKDHNNGQVYNLADGKTLAVIHGEDQDEKGNLIAAAPDLLDALKNLLEALPPRSRAYDKLDLVYHAGRAAIAKARGN